MKAFFPQKYILKKKGGGWVGALFVFKVPVLLRPTGQSPQADREAALLINKKKISKGLHSFGNQYELHVLTHVFFPCGGNTW